MLSIRPKLRLTKEVCNRHCVTGVTKTLTRPSWLGGNVHLNVYIHVPNPMPSPPIPPPTPTPTRFRMHCPLWTVPRGPSLVDRPSWTIPRRLSLVDCPSWSVPSGVAMCGDL